MDFLYRRKLESRKNVPKVETATDTSAAPLSKKTKKKIYLKALIPIMAAAIGGLLVGQILTVTMHPFIVEGESMEPTLDNKQIITSEVVSDDTALERGEIVVVDMSGIEGYSGYFIKRIVGVPGDTLQIRKGLLFINDIVPEEYQFESIKIPGCLEDKLTLGEDQYFVMGDNRNNSTDSRMFGAVSKEQIINIVKEK